MPLMYPDDDFTDEEKGDKASREIFGRNAQRFGSQNKESEYALRYKQAKKEQSKNIEEEQEQQKKDPEKEKFEKQVLELRKVNPGLTFEDWSKELLQRRFTFNQKVKEYFPSMFLPLSFELSVKTILNIKDITLPFMGIIFAAPSSLKTQVIELLRKFWYSEYTDKFTAAAFVSHSANVPKDKLSDIDMLPRIKDKIFLTPELSPLFTGKDDDIREQFGIITRVLDGKGLETNSGVHGKRGYEGEFMFTWIGAAVNIPNYVYKFLSTIGFKIYFLRLDKTEETEDDLVQQLTSKKTFQEKIEEIRNLLFEYLMWFEICPISVSKNTAAKIPWDFKKDEKNALAIIARHALLLAHLRGSITVQRSSDKEDYTSFENEIGTDNDYSTTTNISMYNHGIPNIEQAHRANQQLYNLARGHALSQGRNYITKEDLSLINKVVFSTSSLERVIVFNLLILHKGTLTTSIITKSLNISERMAKKTMTEFKGLGLVTVGQKENSEYYIKLNDKFNWFLSRVFRVKIRATKK